MATNADAQIRVTANTQDAVSQLNNLTNSAKQLNEAIGGLRKNSGKNAFSKELEDLKNFSREYGKMREQLAQDINLNNMTRSLKEQASAYKELTTQQKNYQRSRVAGAEKEFYSIDKLAKREQDYQTIFKQRQHAYKASADAYDRAMQKYEKSLASQQQYENALSSREQITTNGFLKRIQNSAAYIAGYAGFDAITSSLTSGLNAIKEYESGITDLRRTLSEGTMTHTEFEASLSNFGRSAIEKSKEFGVAITEVQDAMTELSRAGVEAGDLNGMTETVLMGLNTTELKSAQEVTSALVSTIKQMNMEWSDSGMILDSWNYLADRYAVQTDDFAHAIERSGSASKMLGMDLYDLNAVVTILGESTQASGEQVGTAFRSLSARLLRDSTIEKLEGYGIQVKKDADTFLDFQSIMENINEVIKDLPDDSPILSDIMDTLGGAWRKNWITALTQDFDRFDELVKEQAESVGYSTEENTKAMDTIEKKAESLKQTFLEAFIDIGEEGGAKEGIKDLLDGTQKALEAMINSPTLRSVLDLMFGNPIQALGLASIAGVFTKLNKGISPLQQLAKIVVSKVPNDGNTFGAWLNNMYQASGVSGKQNRAAKLYDDLKNTYSLTDTEMLPVAERIDGIFNSNTKSVAEHRSELERYSASVKDARSSLKGLLSEKGRDDFFESFGIVDQRYNGEMQIQIERQISDAYEREIARRSDLLIKAQNDYNKAKKMYKGDDIVSNNERGLFGSLTTAKFKEGIRGMVGGLASMGVQMLAIGAAAKGIDYILNHNQNAKDDFDKSMKSYQEQMSQIKANKTMAEDLQQTMNRQGRLVSADGTNKGLNDHDYAQFMSQLQQLKDMGPEVASAIEQSARQLGNFGEAAEVAAEALAKLESKEANRFLREEGKNYEKNMDAWLSSVDKAENAYEGLTRNANRQKALKGLGLFLANDKDGAIGNRDALNDEKYQLSNLEKVLDNREQITAKLKEAKVGEKDIEEYFDAIGEAQFAIESAKFDTQDQVGAFLDSVSPSVKKEIENYDGLKSSLIDLVDAAQSVEQTEMLGNFAKNISKSRSSLLEYNKLASSLAGDEFSKKTLKDVTKSLDEFAEHAASAGWVEKDEKDSFLSALYDQYFEMPKATYDKKLKAAKDRLKDFEIDFKKAFGKNSLEDLNANQFKGATDLINSLAYALDPDNLKISNKMRNIAGKFKDKLNEGLFAESDFEQIDLSNFLNIDEGSATQILDTIERVKTGTGELGRILNTAFTNDEGILDLASAFNHLSTVAIEGQSGFVGAVQGILNSVGELSQLDTAKLISELASMFDITLNKDILLPLGFKISEDGTSIEAIKDEMENGEPVKVPIKGKVEVDESQAEEEGKKAGQAYKDGAEGADPPKAPPIEGNTEGATEAGQEASNAYNNEVENGTPPKAPAPEVTEPEPVKIPTEFEIDENNSLVNFLTDNELTRNPIRPQVDTSDVEKANEEIQSLLELGSGDKQVNFEVAFEKKDDILDQFKEETIKVNIEGNTKDLESKLEGIGKDKTVKVNVEANTNETDSFFSRIEGKDVDVEVNVNANTSDAEAQIERLGGRHRSVDVDVEANIGDAIREVNSLGDVTPHVDVTVTADVSKATSAISSLNKSHEVNVTVTADVGQASSTISSMIGNARAGLSGLSAMASMIAGKINSAAAMASSTSSTLTTVVGQAQTATNAVNTLRATAAQPITFNIDASQLQQLPGQVQSANAAASAAMNSMIAQINATAAAFQAGCSAIVSAWASMSFPVPHIPAIPAPRIAGGGGGGFADGGVVNFTGLTNVHGSPNSPEVVFNARDAKKLYDLVRSGDFGTKKKESREAPPEITVMSATTISEAIQRSMTHVLEDAMKDYSNLMKESWESFSHDYNMSTTNGYYANKIDTPYLELDPEAKDALKQFVNTKIEIKGWDVKDASYIKEYIMQDSSRLQKLSDEMKQQVEYYETIGDSIGKANAETELMIFMQKQSKALRQDANELARELAALEKEKGQDFSKYLDANLELNYLYAKQVASFGEGNSEAKEAFENGVKAYQELAKALDEAKKTMKELAIEMDKQIHKLATEYLENSINKGYDSQRDYYQDRLDRLDREQEQYEKDIEEQRKKLDKAKKDFDNDIQAKIDKIKDAQEKREDEEKLKKLQEKIKDAEDRLNGLKNEYDTKVYSIDENGEWQFSYEANPEELEEAVEDLEEAQEDLKEYYEDKEIDRLEKERENYEKQYDQMVEALEEQQEMRLEQYDQEREALEKHLEQVEDMREQALEQLDKLAYQFVERLKSMFRYDLGKVNDYLNTMNGNANVQSYNPLSELVPTKYAQQLAATGVNLEKYTNELLEITRNAGKYDPQAVQKAISELKKLGTTGAIDLGSSIKMNPQLQHALDKLGTTSINDLIFHNLNRIGEIRGEAFGDKQGTVVTAHDMAKYFKYLGIETSAIQLSQLKDKIAKQELDWKGNPLIDVFDRMENFGTNINFGETGQGLLNDSAWKDLMGTIMGFDGTAQNIYDITGQLITNSEEDLALGDNVILALMGNNKFLESLMGQNKEYYDKVSQFFTDIIGKMDANEFFNSADGFMNKHLEYALQGSSDVNKFIIETLQRIGSERNDGTEVTANDVFKYFDKLGINGKLVLNTIKSTTGLSDATNSNNVILDKNGNIIGINTEYTGKLNKTNLELLSASLKNIASQNGLTAEIEGLPKDFQEILNNFANIIDSIVAGMKDTTPSEDEIQNNLQAAADALNATFGRGGNKETLDAQKQQTKSLQENTQTISIDTYASNSLNKTNVELDKTTQANNKGQESLNSTIIKSTGDIRSTVNTFTARLGEYIASVKQTALRAEKAADKAESAADKAERAASRAESAARRAASAASSAASSSANKKPVKTQVHVAKKVNKYADGGIVDYTGFANVHGSPNSPEVVFNATDAKKLYNIVRSIDFTTANLPHLSPVNLAPYVAGFMSNHTVGESINIDNITMEFPQVNDPDGVKKAILDLGRNIKLYT